MSGFAVSGVGQCDEMTRKQIPIRQSKLTLFALHHPVGIATASGVLLFVWTMVIVRDWRAGVGAGVAAAFIVGYLWSRWGWARRREQRLYDDNGDRREQSPIT